VRKNPGKGGQKSVFKSGTESEINREKQIDKASIVVKYGPKHNII